MPKVGDKHFPYTEEGYAAAAKAKKGKGYNEGGVAELTEEDKEKLRKLKAAQNKKNRGAVARGRPPTPEERQMMGEPRGDRVKRSNPPTSLKRGGKVGAARKNHKGCGCVMEGRRKKTLYT